MSNPESSDYSHPVRFKAGNVFNNAGKNGVVDDPAGPISVHRSQIKYVNIADCVDMHCDSQKKLMVFDEVGDLFGFPGQFIAESEYQWEGVTRNGITYSDTRVGVH